MKAQMVVRGLMLIVVLGFGSLLIWGLRQPVPAAKTPWKLAVAPPPDWLPSDNHYMIGIPVILDPIFAKDGAPEPPPSLALVPRDWAKPACPDETLYAIEKWAWHRFPPRDEPAQMGPGGVHLNAVLELYRTFQSAGTARCFIPSGGVSFIDRDTGAVYESLSADSIVVPPDGRPFDKVSIRMPGTVRAGSVRFNSPEGVISEVAFDFESGMAKPVTGAKPFNAQ